MFMSENKPGIPASIFWPLAQNNLQNQKQSLEMIRGSGLTILNNNNYTNPQRIREKVSIKSYKSSILNKIFCLAFAIEILLIFFVVV